MNQAGEKHSVVESTQVVLRERLQENPSLPNLYYVLSESQSAGRGRLGHQWSSLSGNLHVSILIKNNPLEVVTWVPLWISVSVYRALLELGMYADSVRLKWPNDLCLKDFKKIAGILCEKKGDFIFAGIGINLASAPIETAAVVPGAGLLNPESVLEKILLQLSKPTTIDEIRNGYQSRELFKTGNLIYWDEQGVRKNGEVVGLGKFGELLVKTENGTLPLYSEEVHSVRI